MQSPTTGDLIADLRDQRDRDEADTLARLLDEHREET